MRDPETFEPRMTVKEYFELEANSEIKHEFWWGVPLAMAGARKDHVRVVGDTYQALAKRLEGTPCEAGTGDLRVAIDEQENFVYPDVVVWCDADSQGGEHLPLDTLLSPVVIVEVLSPGTQLRDRRDKLDSYRQLPSLRDYLMISPERVSVDHYARAANSNAWVNHHYIRRADILRLATLDLEIEVAEFYRRLNVPEGLRVLASN